MSASAGLPSRLSIDSGVLLAYFFGEELGELVRSEVLGPTGKMVLCSRLCLSELFYVLCKRRNLAFAQESLATLLRTDYVNVIGTDDWI